MAGQAVLVKQAQRRLHRCSQRAAVGLAALARCAWAPATLPKSSPTAQPLLGLARQLAHSTTTIITLRVGLASVVALQVQGVLAWAVAATAALIALAAL